MAQGFLPDALRPFANSNSGWTVLTALVVWLLRGRTTSSAAYGFAGFVGLVLGYTLVSQLRGLYYNPLLYGAIGAIVGPFVGVAAGWLRRRGWRPAVGAGLLAGIAIGDGIAGLIQVADTTGAFYWVLIGFAGIALLVVTVRLRALRGREVLLAVLAAALATGAYYLASTVLLYDR